jgi:hypothetical protein
VRLFGFGRKRQRSPDLQAKLDELAIETRRTTLDERIQRNELLQRAAQRDPVAAASIAFSATGGRSKTLGRSMPIQTREPLGDKVIETLVTKMLSEREDDPALKIARLRRAALEDRALRRVMEADDDDDDDGHGSIVRDVMVALMTAIGAAMAPQLASYAPAVAAKLQAATGAPSPESGTAGADRAPHRLGAGSASSAPSNPTPGGLPMSPNVSPLSRIKVRFVLRQLDQQSPEDFAVWALGQPAAEAMLVDLADTPDDQLDALLEDAIADPSTAEWHEVLSWLRDHPSDAKRIVAEIRHQLEADEKADAPVSAETADQPPRFATGGW